MTKQRLSDRIMDALELAIEQKDLEVIDLLNKALEVTMSRKAAKAEDFVERRKQPEQIDDLMLRLMIIKGQE